MPLKDPVCGMTVTAQSFYHLEEDGHTHYFCGAKCKARFAQHLGGNGHRDTAVSMATRNAPLWRKVQLRWLLLLLVGLTTLMVVYQQLA